MSKNLSKAAQWIQRQIDELEAKRNQLGDEQGRIDSELAEVRSQIDDLEEVLEKIISEKQVENGLPNRE